MPAIPENRQTTEYLMESGTSCDPRRDYLGMSSLGNSCARALWYSFHWASPQEQHTPRQKRIFNRGDLEEARIISDLKAIGYEVFRLDSQGNEVEMTGAIGEEQEELLGFAGHVRGHPDGRVRGVIEAPKTVHLLEMKTAKASKFAEFKKKGVKRTSPTYYSQAQSYMNKMSLTRTLFIVTNKDTEERYYERIPFDKDDALELSRRESIIVTSEEPLEKLSNNRNWIDCKWCNHSGVCHDKKTPEQNCRTCVYVDIESNGVWSCGNDDQMLEKLPTEVQLVGCPLYKKGWSL
jgi:hypothetical protein